MSRRPTRSQLEIVPVDDGLVVLVPDRGAVVRLNVTAAAILRCCDGTQTADEIAAQVGRTFGLAAPPTGSTQACVEALTDAGLVRC